MKRLTLLFCSLMFLAALANAQYTTSYTYGAQDLTSYATSGTNVWYKLAGNGICAQLSQAYDGNLWCRNSNNTIFKFVNQAWATQTALGGMQGIAVQSDLNIWGLQSTSYCTSLNAGYGIYHWTGSAWTQPSSTSCLATLQIGSDGTLVGVQTGGKLFTSPDGTSWTQLGTGTGWTFASIGSASDICAVSGGHLYTLVSGSMTMFSPQPSGTTAGCTSTPGYMKHPIFATWDTTGAVHLLSGTWQNVSGLVAGSMVAADKSTVYAMDATGHPYHWNVYSPSTTGTLGGNWSQFPGMNPSGAPQHTLTIGVKYPHSIDGTPHTQVKQYNQTFNVVSTDSNPMCDLFVGASGDPECQPATTGNETCSQVGHIGNPGLPSFPCLSNVVPPQFIGWSHGTTVDIYVSNHWNGTEQSAICTGIVTWAVFNQNTYVCHSATAPPAESYQGSYIWVSYEPTWTIPVPMSANEPCGYYYFHGYGTTECPIGGVVKHPWIRVGPFTDAQLQGVAAHEEGHDNFLFNCFNCQYGGSVMGSQGTWETSQPTAPTACDIFWAGIWSFI